MSKVDFFGHFFYFFLFLGMLLIQYKDYRGWAFRFAGEAGWIVIGLVMGMSSIWAWGFVFLTVDALGFLKWQKEHREPEEVDHEQFVLDYIRAQQKEDDFWSDNEGPDCSSDKHIEGCREFEKRPLTPAVLMDVLQDVVHKDTGKSRPAKSVKVKKNVKRKASVRKASKSSRPKGRRVPSVRKVRSRKVSGRKIRVSKKGM